MPSLNRRGFLLTTSAGVGGALALGAYPTSASAHESLMRQTLDRVVAPEGPPSPRSVPPSVTATSC
ncbi:hypothetical protein ACWGSK_24735 [Nocardiopsis sp. NPDC055551]